MLIHLVMFFIIFQRSCVLRWLAAVSINLGKDAIEPHLVDILSPVYRELELATSYKGNIFKTVKMMFNAS